MNMQLSNVPSLLYEQWNERQETGEGGKLSKCVAKCELLKIKVVEKCSIHYSVMISPFGNQAMFWIRDNSFALHPHPKGQLH